MKRLIENQVDENELEELYGGSGSGCGCHNACHLTKSWGYADEDNDEVAF